MAKKDNVALAWMIGLGTLAVAGVGIYFYEKSQPPAPTGGGSTGVSQTPPVPASGDVNAVAATINGQSITFAQTAQIAANLNHTTVAAWQASGIPTAEYANLSPIAQQALKMYGINVV